MSTALVTAAQGWDGSSSTWPVFPFIWFLMIVTFAYLLTRWGRRNRAECAARSGRSRLAERFAAGELEVEEYRAKLAILREE